MDELKKWALAALVRAVKTAAQAAVAAIGAATIFTAVDWSVVGMTALLSFVLSLLTSVAGLPEVEGGASVAKIAKGSGDDGD
jgi:hypothetical protein